MAYTEHLPYKPGDVAEGAVALLAEQLLIPNTFTKHGIDQFKGKRSDTITFTVPGVLAAQDIPWRDYGVTPIDLQHYEESTVAIKFGGEAINAVGIADIQREFDLDPAGLGDLMSQQTAALATHVNRKAVKYLTDFNKYEVSIANFDLDPLRALRQARYVMNKFRVPGQRIVMCGSEVEDLLLSHPSLTTAFNVGEGTSMEALKNAKIGSWQGFTFVVDTTLPDTEAHVYVPGAHHFLNAAPSVPSAAVIGGTASVDNVALRWIKDYDTQTQTERSTMNTWYGFDSVLDSLVGWDKTAQKGFVTEAQYFVRGLKLTIGGTDKKPAATSELAKALELNQKLVGGITAPAPEPAPAA